MLSREQTVSTHLKKGNQWQGVRVSLYMHCAKLIFVLVCLWARAFANTCGTCSVYMFRMCYVPFSLPFVDETFVRSIKRAACFFLIG